MSESVDDVTLSGFVLPVLQLESDCFSCAVKARGSLAEFLPITGSILPASARATKSSPYLDLKSSCGVRTCMSNA